MKRNVVLLFAAECLVSFCAFSANIRWGHWNSELGIWDEAEFGQLWVDKYNTPPIWYYQTDPYLHLSTDSTDSLPLVFWAYDQNYMEYGYTWVVAGKGDLASRKYFAQKDSYLYRGGIGTEYTNYTDSRRDYPLIISSGETVYLAWEQMWFDEPDVYKYGWLEISMDDNWRLSVLNIALDLDGDPIVVGWMPSDTTPEPSAGLLLLLGGATLALRRALR